MLWLVVAPTFDGRAVGGHIGRQGHLAVDTNSLLYSAVAVNARGVGAMVVSLAGPATFPARPTPRFASDRFTSNR